VAEQREPVPAPAVQHFERDLLGGGRVRKEQAPRQDGQDHQLEIPERHLVYDLLKSASLDEQIWRRGTPAPRAAWLAHVGMLRGRSPPPLERPGLACSGLVADRVALRKRFTVAPWSRRPGAVSAHVQCGP